MSSRSATGEAMTNEQICQAEAQGQLTSVFSPTLR